MVVDYVPDFTFARLLGLWLNGEVKHLLWLGLWLWIIIMDCKICWSNFKLTMRFGGGCLSLCPVCCIFQAQMIQVYEISQNVGFTMPVGVLQIHLTRYMHWWLKGKFQLFLSKGLWTLLQIDQFSQLYEACTSLSYSGSNVGFSFVKVYPEEAWVGTHCENQGMRH